MTYTTAKVRTWTRLSDNDGLVFDSEYDRVFGNVREMMDGLAKSADYTILAGDEVGIIRVTNAVTKETTKAFSAATPSVVSDVAHGLVTGDTIVVSGSTVPAEIGDRHYTVTRITDDTFSLDNTVNAGGGGGNLDWRKDVTITLPAAASHDDNIYTVMKVDANEGAVILTDGSTDYLLEGQYDFVTVKSDGTAWQEIGVDRRKGRASAKELRTYMFNDTDFLEKAGLFSAGSSGTVVFPELPDETVAILVDVKISAVAAETFISLDVRPLTGDGPAVAFELKDADSDAKTLSGFIIVSTTRNTVFYTTRAGTTVNWFNIAGYMVEK